MRSTGTEMKLHAFISDPEAYIKGDFDYAITLRVDRAFIERVFPEWNYLGEVEINVEADETIVRQTAIALIDESIQKARAASTVAINELETRKQNLLALTAPGAK